MFKLLRHFWATLSFATAILGLLLIPNDVADSKQAIARWSAHFTPTNREIILVSLLVIFGIRIAYVDIQGALNGREWPSLRFRITDFLGRVFKRDKRIAELKKLGDNADVKLLTKSLQAKVFLNSLDWQPIPLPDIRPFVTRPDQPGMPAGYMHGKAVMTYNHLTDMQMRGINAEISRRMLTLKIPGFMEGDAINRLIEGEVQACADGHELRRFIMSSPHRVVRVVS